MNKLNQTQLANRLGVSSPVVSQWQSGARNPLPRQLVKLAEMAPDPLSTRFLELAGISAASLIHFSSEMEKGYKRFLETLEDVSGPTASIPILKSEAAVTRPAAPLSSDIEGWLAVDAALVPPSSRAIRVQESHWNPGSSYPAVGDLIVFDIKCPVDGSNIDTVWGTGQLFAVSVVPVGDESEEHDFEPVSPSELGGMHRIHPLRPGLYVGPMELTTFQWSRFEIEEVRVVTGSQVPWLLAYRYTALGETEAKVKLAGHAMPAIRDTGGRFILHPGVQFILPVVQLIHPRAVTAK